MMPSSIRSLPSAMTVAGVALAALLSACSSAAPGDDDGPTRAPSGPSDGGAPSTAGDGGPPGADDGDAPPGQDGGLPAEPATPCKDGAKEACAVIAGACATGIRTCAAQTWGPCVFTDPPHPPATCTTACTGGTLSGESLFTPVNRFAGLKSDWAPAGLVTVPLPYRTGDAAQRLRAAASAHLVDLLKAASDNGTPAYCRSPYRSFAVQCSLFASYAASDGCAAANTYSAQAGHSEHQLGTVCDLAKPNGDFLDGKGGADTFLAQNAYKHGFIMSYPAGTESLTGYQYEPWHWRYIGVKAALLHHDMETKAGRTVSTHELMASLACLTPAQLDALEQ